MKPEPPKSALKLLRWFCREDYLEEFEGNLLELYEEQYLQNPVKAKWKFIWNVIRHFRWKFLKFYKPKKYSNSKDMFFNYLKSAWRNINKRKQFSLLNILGLSIGMAACLLILQYVNYEESYDTFHPDLNQLYRLNLGMSEAGETEVTFRAANHPAAAQAMKQDFPQVEEVARMVDVNIFMGSSVLSYEPDGHTIKTHYEEHMYVADPALLKMFDFPMVKGSLETALNSKDNIVISESLAKKYFGEEDPMGKTMSLNGRIGLTVTGVLQDLPANTHMDISALFSSMVFPPNINNAWIWPEFYTYVKLIPKVEAQLVEDQLDGFADKYLGDIMKEFGIVEKMTLQPVKDIHLQGNLMKEIKENGNQKAVSFLVVIAFMILFIAWINFVNLSTSRSLERASEVGIRKVVGARKGNIIFQFLTESALVNAIAIGLAIILVILVLPYFDQLTGQQIIGEKSTTQIWEQAATWKAMFLLFLGGTFLAGLYPAFVLSSFQPIKTIKGKIYQSTRKIHFRHVMVIFQFVIGMLMITGTIIVFQQLSYMRNQDLGFNMDQMLIIKAPSITDSTFWDKSRLFREQILQSPQVENVTTSSDIPGHNIQNVNTIRRKEQSIEEGFFATYISSDEHYFSTYEIDLLTGRFFTEDFKTDVLSVIINEKAVEMLGYSSPEDVLGKVITIKANGWTDCTVIGVAKNIHNQSLAFTQLPFVFFNRWGFNIDYLSIRVNTSNLNRTIGEIEHSYQKVFPGNPVEYFFLDDYFNKQYQANRQFGRVFSLFAFLAILVACLGLFGLASYVATLRTKETGIRKILGASTAQIFMLLGKQFIWLIVIAALVGIPIVWWGGNLWLNNFAYRINLNIWIFIVPVLALFLITLLIVFSQSSRAAFANPVDSLRDE